VLIGDHNQLPPVIKNTAFQKYSKMDQSLFTRFVRLGVPYIELNAQGRARPQVLPGNTALLTRTCQHTYRVLLHATITLRIDEKACVSLGLPIASLWLLRGVYVVGGVCLDPRRVLCIHYTY